MLQESMKKEMSCSQGTHSALDLFRTPSMRTTTICLSAVWSVQIETESNAVLSNLIPFTAIQYRAGQSDHLISLIV